MINKRQMLIRMRHHAIRCGCLVAILTLSLCIVFLADRFCLGTDFDAYISVLGLLSITFAYAPVLAIPAYVIAMMISPLYRRDKRLGWIAISIYLVFLYVYSFIILMNRSHVSVDLEGKVRYMFCFRIAPPVRVPGDLTIYAHQESLLNRVYLPADDLWRWVRSD